MVRLTTCADGFEARLVAARLGSEGVVWSLRGGHDGPLAFGTVDVLVDADDLEVAQEVLGLEVIEAAPERETTGRDVLVIVAVLAAAVLFAIARMAAPV